MTEQEIQDQETVDEAVLGSRNVGVRRLIWGLGIVTIISLLVGLVAIGIALRNYYSLNEESLGLVRQIRAECASGEVKDSICERANKIEKKASEAPDPISIPIPGPQGPEGPEGPRGPRGSEGPRGATGAEGEEGERGADGESGSDGSAGASAYDLAVGTGFQGTLEDWLASLKGAQGIAGPQGPEGPQGPTGPQGPEGTDGEDAWPFEFEIAFATRSGREYTCLVQIGEDGTQTNRPAGCTPSDEGPITDPSAPPSE